MAKELKKPRNEARTRKWVAGILIVSGSIGLLASFALSVDAFTLLKDPNAVLSCSINTILNCVQVMKTAQSEIVRYPE